MSSAQPTPEDLRQIRFAHYRAAKRKGLPKARAALATAIARKRALFPKG